MSKRLDHLQACGRGTGTVGSRSCGWGVVVFFESKCPKRGGGVPLRNSTSDQDGEGPCRLVACPLSAWSCMCTPLSSKSIAGGPQASVWLPAVFGPAIILAPFSAGQAPRPPSSELRDRLRATPPTVHQFHAITFSIQRLTLDSERSSLDPPSVIPFDLQTHKHNHDGTWRRKSWWRRTPCAAPAHQLHFQASPATLGCPDLAVRAGTSFPNSLGALST